MFPRQESPPRDPASGRTVHAPGDDADDSLVGHRPISVEATDPGSALRAYAPRALTPFTPLRTGVPAPTSSRQVRRHGWDRHAATAGVIGVGIACLSMVGIIAWALLT